MTPTSYLSVSVGQKSRHGLVSTRLKSNCQLELLPYLGLKVLSILFRCWENALPCGCMIVVPVSCQLSVRILYQLEAFHYRSPPNSLGVCCFLVVSSRVSLQSFVFFYWAHLTMLDPPEIISSFWLTQSQLNSNVIKGVIPHYIHWPCPNQGEGIIQGMCTKDWKYWGPF